MNLNNIGEGDGFARGFQCEGLAVNVPPEESKRLGTGGIGRNVGFFGFGMDEFPVAPDEAEVGKIVFIVGTGKERNEMRSIGPGLAHFEREPGTGLF